MIHTLLHKCSSPFHPASPGLLKQYSEFISFPIKLWTTSFVNEQVMDEEATTKAQEEADKKAEEEGKEKTTIEPVFKTERREEQAWKVGWVERGGGAKGGPCCKRPWFALENIQCVGPARGVYHWA